MTESEATNYAVWVLTQQPRSEKEIGDRLTKKGADEETILTALEKLRGWGIDAEATRQATRGAVRNFDPIWRQKAQEDGRLRKFFRSCSS